MCWNVIIYNGYLNRNNGKVSKFTKGKINSQSQDFSSAKECTKKKYNLNDRETSLKTSNL